MQLEEDGDEAEPAAGGPAGAAAGAAGAAGAEPRKINRTLLRRRRKAATRREGEGGVKMTCAQRKLLKKRKPSREAMLPGRETEDDSEARRTHARERTHAFTRARTRAHTLTNRFTPVPPSATPVPPPTHTHAPAHTSPTYPLRPHHPTDRPGPHPEAASAPADGVDGWAG